MAFKGNPEHIHPKFLNDVLNEVKSTGKERIVNTVMLRSMKRLLQRGMPWPFRSRHEVLLPFHCTYKKIPGPVNPQNNQRNFGRRCLQGRIKTLKQAMEAADQSSLTGAGPRKLRREVEKLKANIWLSYWRKIPRDHQRYGIIRFLCGVGKYN